MRSDSVLPGLTKNLAGKDHVFSSRNLEINPSTTFDEWQSLGMSLRSLERTTKWWIADWLLFGEGQFGEMASQVMNDLGYEYQTLANLKWVAGRISVSRRRENLSFAHHQEVAKLEPQEQDHWLEKAQVGGWTRDVLRKELAGEGISKPVHELRITALAVRVEDGCIAVAIECKGVQRTVLAGRIESLGTGRWKTVSASMMAKVFNL